MLALRSSALPRYVSKSPSISSTLTFEYAARRSVRKRCARPETTIFISCPCVAKCSMTTRLRVAWPIPSPTTPYRIFTGSEHATFSWFEAATDVRRPGVTFSIRQAAALPELPRPLSAARGTNRPRRAHPGRSQGPRCGARHSRAHQGSRVGREKCRGASARARGRKLLQGLRCTRGRPHPARLSSKPQKAENRAARRQTCQGQATEQTREGVTCPL